MTRLARSTLRMALSLVNGWCLAVLIIPPAQLIGLTDPAPPTTLTDVPSTTGIAIATGAMRDGFAQDAAAFGLTVIDEHAIERIGPRAVTVRFTAGVTLSQRTMPTFLLERIMVVAEHADGSTSLIAQTDLRLQYADEHVVLEYVDSFSPALDAYAGRTTTLAGMRIRRTAEFDSGDLEAFVARQAAAVAAGTARSPSSTQFPDQPEARNYTETVTIVGSDGREQSYDAGEVDVAAILAGAEGKSSGITVGCVTNCFEEAGGTIGLVTALCIVAGLAVCVAACAVSAGVACLPCIGGAGAVCGVAIAAGSLGVCIARCINPSFNPPPPTATRTRTPTFTPTPRPCAGDCDGTRIVTVAELVRGVRMVLDALSPTACARFDVDGNRVVTVNELVAAVNAALRGCDSAS